MKPAQYGFAELPNAAMKWSSGLPYKVQVMVDGEWHDFNLKQIEWLLKSIQTKLNEGKE